MKDPIEEKVNQWDLADERDSTTNKPRINYPLINKQIEHFAENLFSDYEPTKGPYANFWVRLNKWLSNVDSDADKQILFRLIPYIFYVGREEFNTLYRAAYNGPIARWFIEQLNLKLDDDNVELLLREAVNSTWFCPITDSMHISSFCHVNRISGINQRPDWHSLAKFGKADEVEKYINKCGIKRIVLLEDFVGSGSQMLPAVDFAANLISKLPIMIVPLIICPTGANLGIDLEKKYSNITVSPVVQLKKGVFVATTPVQDEKDIFNKTRELVKRLYIKVSGQTSWPHEGKPYSPFGYKETGSLFVMYSNCPDNTLPIIHYKHDTWEPLFPRSTRVG